MVALTLVQLEFPTEGTYSNNPHPEPMSMPTIPKLPKFYEYSEAGTNLGGDNRPGPDGGPKKTQVPSGQGPIYKGTQGLGPKWPLYNLGAQHQKT